MSLILVYFILLNGRTTEREGEDMRGSEGHVRNFSFISFILKENIDMYYWRLSLPGITHTLSNDRNRLTLKIQYEAERYLPAFYIIYVS
jgi:hypothetical protein